MDKIASIGGTDLGKIQNETQTKDTNLFIQALPTNDSDNTILLDLFGTVKNINVEGIFTGTASQINTFVVAIETIASGAQTSSTFVSSLSTYANKTVLVKNFRWSYLAGDPSKIGYVLEMQEGTAVV